MEYWKGESSVEDEAIVDLMDGNLITLISDKNHSYTMTYASAILSNVDDIMRIIQSK
ncbi:MAG: hypothetical protein SFU99_17970 [Saprospiraceae bacterium]|nr:hypothetical protein [Saprospiraceae bacterium]